jgi:hypothetical protein
MAMRDEHQQISQKAALGMGALLIDGDPLALRA